MTREELEQEVFKRLPINGEQDASIMRDALKRKPTKDLESILTRMKAAGR